MTRWIGKVMAMVFLSVFVMGVTDVMAYKMKCRSADRTSIYPAQKFPDHDHDRFGTEPQNLMFEYGAYVASFDSDDDDNGDGVPDLRSVPEWVAYEIKRYGPVTDGQYAPPNISVRRPGTWYDHPRLNFLKANVLGNPRLDDSYRGVGDEWNRGHMAMNSHAYRLGWQQACNTHFFFNAVPQQAELNQGDWVDLEYYTGAAANKFGRVWVIAGPIFNAGQTIQTIGDPGEIPVSVPHAIFKIVIKEPSTGAFPDVLALIYEQPRDEYVVCPQAWNPDANDVSYNHVDNLVSATEIENRTGLRFFQDLAVTQAQLAAFKAQTPTALWPVEARFFGRRCGG